MEPRGTAFAFTEIEKLGKGRNLMRLLNEGER
jgi:hypothetical protein